MSVECADSTTYSGALGTCAEPQGPGPCILGEADQLACPVLCGVCPPPVPDPLPDAPEGGLELVLCSEGNKLSLYMFADVQVAGFQFALVCASDGAGIGGLVPAETGSAVASGFQISTGETGTAVGVNLSGGTIIPGAENLLAEFVLEGEDEVCEACVAEPVFSDPSASAINVVFGCGSGQGPPGSPSSPPPEPSPPLPPPPTPTTDTPSPPPSPVGELCDVTGKEFDLPCDFDVVPDSVINVADVIYLANLILEGPSDPPLDHEIDPPLCDVTSSDDFQLSCNFDFDQTDADNEINLLVRRMRLASSSLRSLRPQCPLVCCFVKVCFLLSERPFSAAGH